MAKTNAEQLSESLIKTRRDIGNLRDSIDSALQEINNELVSFKYKGEEFVEDDKEISDAVVSWVEDELDYLSSVVTQADEDILEALEEFQEKLVEIEETVYEDNDDDS